MKASAQHKTIAKTATVQPAAAQKSVQRKAISAKSPIRVQTAMKISQPHDPAEREAETTAKRIMRMALPEGSIQRRGAESLQRACAPCAAGGASCSQCSDETTLHRAPLPFSPRERGGESGGGAPPIVNDVLRSSGQPLDPGTRSFFEPRFGYDFSGVRVHTDKKAEESARSVNALAYTVGRNIVFGGGQYRPESSEGKHLLAHELTHVVQQRDGNIQRFPSWGDVVDTGRRVGGAVVGAGRSLDAAGSAAIGWLATQAGRVALRMAAAFGVSVRITTRGLEIIVPRICPIRALPFQFNLPPLDRELMVPIFNFPIGPVLISGQVGVVGRIRPAAQIQLGPICLNGVTILINPITNTYGISGSLSATMAVALSGEVRGGIRGALRLAGVVPIGGVPVPVVVPLAGLEGGLAGLIRGIGASTLTMGGGLLISGGVISLSQSRQLDFGLGADLFLGAYGQIDIQGRNVCRIYWQPYAWHGDMAGSLQMSASLLIVPGSPPTIVPRIGLPTFSRIPFNQIPLALSRRGFSDDCPIKDRLCGVLRSLRLFPSYHGGRWSWSGSYGPGTRLVGPRNVYQRDPSRASGAKCRGACGPDCKTCKHYPIFLHADTLTGKIWRYTNFEDCNSHSGCREHDAGFDWAAAAARKGEIGRWAMIMPWHMAANMECACNNPAGNCPAWAFGLPPYDSKIYFADAATVVPVPPLPPTTTPCTPVAPGGSPTVGAAGNNCLPSTSSAVLNWDVVSADAGNWGVCVTSLTLAGAVNIRSWPSQPTSMVVPNTANPVDGGNINNTAGSPNHWQAAIDNMADYDTVGGGAGPNWHSTAASSAHEWEHWNTDYVIDSVGTAAGGDWPQTNTDLNSLREPKATRPTAPVARIALEPRVNARKATWKTNTIRRWNTLETTDRPGLGGRAYAAGARVLSGLIAAIRAYKNSKGW